jgi:hypothetical protein
MTGHRDPHIQVHDEKPAGMLGDRLRLMFDWYKGMVDESTGRLLYLYDPENDVTTGDGELIHDIAAIWDVEVLSAFLGRDDLRPLVRRSLDYFRRLIVERNEYAIVAPRRKQSSIAHSAFLALALSRSEFPDKIHGSHRSSTASSISKGRTVPTRSSSMRSRTAARSCTPPRRCCRSWKRTV